jgi:hypothetical protein
MRDADMQPGNGFRERRSNAAANLEARSSDTPSSARRSGPLDDETRNMFQRLMAESRHETGAPEAVTAAPEIPLDESAEPGGNIIGWLVAFGFGALAARLLSR